MVASQVKSARSDHPSYADMILNAIANLKERKGSSNQAILKFIKANNKVADNAGHRVNTALVKCVLAGKITQTSGKGASGSFKLPADASKKAAASKKPAAKKPAAKKVATPKKKTPAKKAKSPAKKTPKKKTPSKKPVSKVAAKKKSPAKKSSKSPKRRSVKK